MRLERISLNGLTTILVSPVTGGELGTINSMKNELTGRLTGGADYTFRYGFLSPPQMKREGLYSIGITLRRMLM